PEKPVHHPGGMRITFRLVQNHGGWNSDDNQNHNLGRFRLSATASPLPDRDPLPPRVAELLEVPPEERSPAQWQALFRHFRTTVPEWKEANERIEQRWKEHPEGTSQLALMEREEPRPTHFLTRGDFLSPAQEVRPHVPAFLHPLPEGAPLNRLTFARW